VIVLLLSKSGLNGIEKTRVDDGALRPRQNLAFIDYLAYVESIAKKVGEGTRGKPIGGVRKASGVGRGIVKQKKGERAGGDANIAAAKAPMPTSPRNLCVTM
jgi:hypothetical protein